MIRIFGGHDYLIAPNNEGVTLTLAELKNSPIRKAAKIWDETFGITFKECQAEVKALAAQTYKAVRGGTLLDVVASKDIEVRNSDLVVLCEEDEWYHPHVFDRLHAQKSHKHDAIVWRAAQFGFQLQHDPETGAPALRHVLRTPQPITSGVEKSNNFALTGKFFTYRNFNLYSICQQANKASASLSEAVNMAHPIHDVLSMTHRHPCSKFILQHLVKTDPSSLVLKKLVKVYVQSALAPDLAEEYRWAKPYIETSKEIFTRVLQSYKGV